MTLDCSRIAKEIVMASGFFVEGRRQTLLILASDKNKEDEKKTQSKLKVIPLFCTVHPLLRLTLRHPRWWRFFPLGWKEQKKGRFCRAKAFIRANNATDQLTASWFAIEKQDNERNVHDPEVCSGFPLCSHWVVELLKCPGWGCGLWGLWSLLDSSTALQLH